MKTRKKVLLGIFIVVLVLLLFFLLPFSFHKRAFEQKMESRVEALVETKDRCSQEEIDQLPVAMQKHLGFIGLVGTKKFAGVNIEYKKAFFLFDTKKNTQLHINYDLWLLCDPPFRQAYIQSSIFGLPFEGVDYMNKETGGMKGYLGKILPIFDIEEKQAFKAGLISWLAEGAALNPSILLSDYVEFEEIDERSVRAKVTSQGISGEGIFRFNEEGILYSFESDERQVEEVDGVKRAIGWKTYYEDFEEVSYFKLPKSMKATKIYPDKDKEVVYFDSDDYEIIWYK